MTMTNVQLGENRCTTGSVPAGWSRRQLWVHSAHVTTIAYCSL